MQAMFSQVSSNSLDRLADHLLGKLIDDMPSLFVYAPIIVPSSTLAQYLRLYITKRLGVWPGLDLVSLPDFLRLVCPPNPAILSPSALTTGLLTLLADPTYEKHLPPTIQNYLSDGLPTGAKTIQLAQKISSLFIQYASTTPNFRQQWSAPPSDKVTETEKWQRTLWQILTGDDGPWQHLPKEMRGHTLPSWFLTNGKNHEFTANTVILFGFTHWQPTEKMTIATLAQKMQVANYSINPCQEFWEDIAQPDNASSPGTDKTSFPTFDGSPTSNENRQPTNTHGENQQKEDTASLPSHDILRLWGAVGCDQTRFENGLSNYQVTGVFTPVSLADTNCLRGIQQCLLQRQPLPPRQNHNPPTLQDTSIEVHTHYNAARESETIASLIAWRMHQDPSLQLNDFAILCPQHENHAPLYATALEQQGILAHYDQIATHLRNPLFNTFLRLLRFPIGQVTRPKMFDILLDPIVHGRYAKAEPKKWQDWILRAGIMRDPPHDDQIHNTTYHTNNAFHWQQGLHRLVLGLFTQYQVPPDSLQIGEDRYTPVPIASNDLECLSQLIVLTKELLADAKRLANQTMSPARWGITIRQYADKYLFCRTEAQKSQKKQLLDIIEPLSAITTSQLPFQCISLLLTDWIKKHRTTQGDMLATGVYVGPFHATRITPFRHVFVCGLTEDTAPRSDSVTSFDLQKDNPSAIVQTRQNQDRYAMICAILSAKDSLTISCLRAEDQTNQRWGGEYGQTLLPAVTAHQVFHHSQHRFHDQLGPISPAGQRQTDVLALRQQYLLENNKPNSKHSDSPEVGQAQKTQRNIQREKPDSLNLSILPTQWQQILGWQTVAETKQPDASTPTVSLRDLRTFLENPLEGWIRFHFGLRNKQPSNLTHIEDESFCLGPSLYSMVAQHALYHYACHGQSVPNSYRIAKQTWCSFGDVPAGLFAQSEDKRLQRLIGEWAEQISTSSNYRITCHGEDPWFAKGTPAELGSVFHLVDDNQSILRFTASTHPHNEENMLFASSSPTLSTLAKQRQTITAFLEHTFLCSKDQSRPRTASLLSPSSVQTLRLQAIPTSKAQAYLEQLVCDLLTGPHAYHLPYEAVFLAHKKPTLSIADHFASLYQSRSLPSLQFATFPPETATLPEQAEEMAHRRFSLLFSTMEKV